VFHRRRLATAMNVVARRSEWEYCIKWHPENRPFGRPMMVLCPFPGQIGSTFDVHLARSFRIMFMDIERCMIVEQSRTVLAMRRYSIC
jgi:hypothetical protein